MSPVPDSDDEEEKENRKRKRMENLENARKVKKTKAAAEPRTKRNSKTASARILKESQVLCGEDTQAVLNDLDNYLYTYHYGRSGSKVGENSTTEADSFEYSQQNFSEDDDATQLPGPAYDLPAYNGADFESQPIL